MPNRRNLHHFPTPSASTSTLFTRSSREPSKNPTSFLVSRILQRDLKLDCGSLSLTIPVQTTLSFMANHASSRGFTLYLSILREFSYSNADPTSEILIARGDSGFWFQIAAKDTIASGTFIIDFSLAISRSRQTSWGKPENSFSSLYEIPIYSDIPHLKLQVLIDPCHISYLPQYSIPVNGQTNPVIFKFSCSPASDVAITPIYQSNDLLTHETVVIGKNIANKKKALSPHSNLNTESRAEFVFKINGGIVGQIITIQLQINDPTSYQFQNKGFLQLKIVKNTQAIKVVAKDIILLDGIATLQCSKMGQLVWTLGQINSGSWRVDNVQDITLSLNNKIIQEVQTELIKEQINRAYLNKLAQNMIEASNQNQKTVDDQQTNYANKAFFGSLEDQLNYRISKRHIISNANNLVKIKFKDLGDKVHYKIEYFCIDLLNQRSEIKSEKLSGTATTEELVTMPKNVYLKFYFQRELTLQQQNNVLCSLTEVLFLNSYMVTDIKCNQCDENLLGYEKKKWINLLSANETITQVFESAKQEDELNDFILFVSIQGYPSTNGEYSSSLDQINAAIKKIQDDYKLQNEETQTSSDQTATSNKEMPLEVARRQFGFGICNKTDDPEISFVFKNIQITDSPVYNGNYEQAQNIISIESKILKFQALSYLNVSTLNVSSNSSIQNDTAEQIQLKVQSTAEAFLFVAYFGEEEKGAIAYQTYMPSPFQLRRGLMGDGSKIPRFFSQYVKDTATINLGKTLENKLCFYFIIYSSFVIWTSYPKGAHCLSDQYQDTQILLLPQPTVVISYSTLITIVTFLILAMN